VYTAMLCVIYRSNILKMALRTHPGVCMDITHAAIIPHFPRAIKINPLGQFFSEMSAERHSPWAACFYVNSI